MHGARRREGRVVGRAGLMVLLALAGGATAALPAQPIVARCDSLLRASVVGLAKDELRLALRKADSERPLPAGPAMFVLDAIRQHFEMPGSVSTDVFLPVGASQGHGVIVSRLYAELTREGRVKKVGMLIRSSSPALDAALAKAVQAADADQSIGPIGELTDAGMLPVVLDLTTISSASIGVQDAPSIPVGVVSMPVVRGYTTAQATHWPLVRNEEMGRQVVGSISLDYIVDRDGKVAPNTTDVRLYSSEDFAGQVLRALPSWLHSPATVQGCPVRQFAYRRVGAEWR